MKCCQTLTKEVSVFNNFPTVKVGDQVVDAFVGLLLSFWLHDWRLQRFGSWHPRNISLKARVSRLHNIPACLILPFKHFISSIDMSVIFSSDYELPQPRINICRKWRDDIELSGNDILNSSANTQTNLGLKANRRNPLTDKAANLASQTSSCRFNVT